MTDWIMIIITFVYVVATTFICYYNYQSAKAAREQLQEMKQQFAADTYLKTMPCMSIKKIEETLSTNGSLQILLNNKEVVNDCVSQSFYFRIDNVGHDIAKDVQVCVVSPTDASNKLHIFTLPVNDFRVAKLTLLYPCINYMDDTEDTTVTVRICYNDVLNNCYIQTLTIGVRADSSSISLLGYYLSAPTRQPQ